MSFRFFSKKHSTSNFIFYQKYWSDFNETCTIEFLRFQSIGLVFEMGLSKNLNYEHFWDQIHHCVALQSFYPQVVEIKIQHQYEQKTLLLPLTTLVETFFQWTSYAFGYFFVVSYQEENNILSKDIIFVIFSHILHIKFTYKN